MILGAMLKFVSEVLGYIGGQARLGQVIPGVRLT